MWSIIILLNASTYFYIQREVATAVAPQYNNLFFQYPTRGNIDKKTYAVDFGKGDSQVLMTSNILKLLKKNLRFIKKSLNLSLSLDLLQSVYTAGI